MNLASTDNVSAVNKLARTTGSSPVPPGKVEKGYRYENNKFEKANLNHIPAALVSEPLVQECPVQMEAILMHHRSLAEEDEKMKNRIMIFEARIVRVHIDERILMTVKKIA